MAKVLLSYIGQGYELDYIVEQTTKFIKAEWSVSSMHSSSVIITLDMKPGNSQTYPPRNRVWRRPLYSLTTEVSIESEDPSELEIAVEHYISEVGEPFSRKDNVEESGTDH